MASLPTSPLPTSPLPTSPLPTSPLPTSPLTVQEAALRTGWSARMLRYVEQLGLVVAPRSAAGYRLYGPVQLARLRTLRLLLDRYRLDLGDVAVASRLHREPELADALGAWLAAEPPAQPPAQPPAGASAAGPAADDDWLAFEQDKHSHLLPSRQETA